MNGGKTLCPGSGQMPVYPKGNIHAHCPVCRRDLSGWGKSRRVELPKHYVEMNEPPTLFQLRQIEEGYRLVANEAETLRERRNELIRQALATGLTHTQVAEITGLTRGRIGQIAASSG